MTILAVTQNFCSLISVYSATKDSQNFCSLIYSATQDSTNFMISSSFWHVVQSTSIIGLSDTNLTQSFSPPYSSSKFRTLCCRATSTDNWKGVNLWPSLTYSKMTVLRLEAMNAVYFQFSGSTICSPL